VDDVHEAVQPVGEGFLVEPDRLVEVFVLDDAFDVLETGVVEDEAVQVVEGVDRGGQLDEGAELAGERRPTT